MKYIQNHFKAFLIFIMLFFVIPQISAVDEMEVLRSRLYNEYYNSTNEDVNLNYLNTQGADGKWTDILYSDRSITNWDPIKHLQRLRSMAKSYCKQTDKNSIIACNLLSGITNGLNAWLSGGYKSDNWFYNDIGQQREIGPLLALVSNYLPLNIVNEACNYLIVNGNPTLANLVWEAAGVLIKGAILNDVKYVKQGVDYFHMAISPKSKNVEGIQKDYSYLFHGLQLYNGGYGTWMINDVTQWMNMLAGLSFCFQASDIGIVRNLLLQGDQWLVRRGQYDFGCAGRDISRQNGITSLGNKTSLIRMQTIDPANTTLYQNMINHISGTNNGSLIGNKMFYRADCMVQKRLNYHLSVKMCSSRTSGTEYMNGENVKGFWLPFGATCLMKDADEYYSIFPLWDWMRIPGTTSTAELPAFGATLNQTTLFVGGVTNGQCGVAAMDLNKQSLTAKKSWFMFDDEIVCLGAGITSTSANIVNTTIAQSQLRGSVRVDNVTKPAGTDVACNNVKWVFHDNVCYFFPTPTTVLLTNTSKTGNWYSINTSQSNKPITDNIFNLVIPHNLKPVNASYAYIIRPDIQPSQVQSYSDNIPVTILANTPALQAVTQSLQKLTGAVFYAAGDLVVDTSLIVSVDQPCALLIDQSKEPLSVTIADPSQSKASVNVTLKFKSYPYEKITFALPTGDSIGSSISKASNTIRKENFQGVMITRKPYLPLCVNDTFSLQSIVNCPSCGNTNISWSSSNKSVAVVDNKGVITAIGNGSAIITEAIVETGQKSQCEVRVMKRVVNEQFNNIDNLTIIPNGGTWYTSQNVLYLTSPVGSALATPEKNIALVSGQVKGDFVMASNMFVEETTSTWNDFCLIWNHQYPENSFYYAHFCENNDNAGSGVFKITDGVKSAELADISTPLLAGIWHEIALKVSGKKAMVYIDGSLVSTSVCDSNAVGMVGFGSYNDACRYSNLRIWQEDKPTNIDNKICQNIFLKNAGNGNILIDFPECYSSDRITVYNSLGCKILTRRISHNDLVNLGVNKGMVLLFFENERKSVKVILR